MAARRKGTDDRTIARNRRATFDYFIEEEIECGIVLLGSEVKSLRAGRVTLTEAWVQIRDGECWLQGLHIPPYPWANTQNHEPVRSRKLLLHRRQIDRLHGRVTRSGFTLVPMTLYFAGSHIKLRMGLGKGKKLHDKRQTIRAREQERDARRAMRER